MCASHWACTKPRGTMKVKAVRTVGSGRIRGLETACGALPARLDRSVGEAALERNDRVELNGTPQGESERKTEETRSSEGGSRPSRLVPWDRPAWKPEPGGRPIPGEAEAP